MSTPVKTEDAWYVWSLKRIKTLDHNNAKTEITPDLDILIMRNDNVIRSGLELLAERFGIEIVDNDDLLLQYDDEEKKIYGPLTGLEEQRFLYQMMFFLLGVIEFRLNNFCGKEKKV